MVPGVTVLAAAAFVRFCSFIGLFIILVVSVAADFIRPEQLAVAAVIVIVIAVRMRWRMTVHAFS